MSSESQESTSGENRTETVQKARNGSNKDRDLEEASSERSRERDGSDQLADSGEDFTPQTFLKIFSRAA